MTKRIIITSLILSLGLSGFSQKIDLDRLRFTLTFRKLAEKPLAPTYRTYRVTATSSNYSEIADSKTNGINLAGFRKDNAAPSFSVNFNFGSLIIAKTEVVERVVVNKNKDGVETGRVYYYKLVVDYNISASFQLVTKEGTVHATENTNLVKKYQTQEYNKYSDAQNFWNNNISSLKAEFASSTYQEYVNFTNTRLNNMVGYPETTENRNLWITDSPKHPENDAYKSACQATADQLKTISAQVSTDNVFSALAPQIEYFNSIKGKFAADEKADRKLRYGAFYNLAMIYLLTDKPDKAIEMAQALIDNDYDKLDGKLIINEANALKALFALNKFSTTHFTDDFLDTVK